MEPIIIKKIRIRIGDAIRRLREENRLSSQKLAKVLDLTQSTISRIENGKASISAERLCFIAKTFNKPLSFFVGLQSPVVFDEMDILRAAAAHYGAKHLAYKLTINVQEYYVSYADFLNAALKDANDPRMAAAIAATLYHQASSDRINRTRIVTTIQHPRLAANLVAIIKRTLECILQIDRPKKEKELAANQLAGLCDELENIGGFNLTKSDIADFDAASIIQYI